jgi:hypothetical protein
MKRSKILQISEGKEKQLLAEVQKKKLTSFSDFFADLSLFRRTDLCPLLRFGRGCGSSSRGSSSLCLRFSGFEDDNGVC